jgi:hypothetical protein
MKLSRKDRLGLLLIKWGVNLLSPRVLHQYAFEVAKAVERSIG